MMAATLGALVLGGALDMVVSHHQHYREQQMLAELQQEVRGGIHVLASELRLAGTGILLGRPPLAVMGGEEVAFESNVNDVRAMLAKAAAAGQDWVQVASRWGWTKGKRIVVCGLAGCEEHVLSRDSSTGKLHLSDRLTRDFPAGSPVEIVNRVRYYLSRRAPGTATLMREVDAGANPLVESVEGFSLSYLTADGRPAERAEEITLIRLHLEASHPNGRGGRIRRTHEQELALRVL
jgi:hypothetical protein